MLRYNHSKGHLAANMVLKQLADFLAEITDELNVEAVWFRVESHVNVVNPFLINQKCTF